MTVAHTTSAQPPQTASLSQRRAIEADLGPLLVLAGPGAGKTFCLIERIRFLIEQRDFDPSRILAFTFTNKAAEEIASRLAQLGADGARVKRGTIHAYCAEILREFGEQVGLQRGFGIADEDYQLGVLARLQGSRPWHGKLLTSFSAHRFCGVNLQPVDRALFADYVAFLRDRNLVDFDMLVLKAAELLENHSGAAKNICSQWQALLVDEFQDLNSGQYRVIHELARDHNNIFAVGDHEQSIFSWTGADRKIFSQFMNDFHIAQSDTVHLGENHRCPVEVFGPARTLLAQNLPLFEGYQPAAAHRTSGYAIETRGFANDDDECSWIVNDVLRDLAGGGRTYGDIALLYRKHSIGEEIETAFLNAGIPCRLAQGRALAEDPVVAFVVAALHVISCPNDDICRDNFFSVVMPRPLFEEARAQAEAARHSLRRQLNYMFARRPRGDEGRRQIRRALSAWKNLEATARQHDNLHSLIQELVAQRIRRLQSVLDERHEDLSDPAGYPEVVKLADRLRHARETDSTISIERLGGAELALKGMLAGCGFRQFEFAEFASGNSEFLCRDDCTTLGLPLGVFKAAQLLEMGDFTVGARDFTAVDLEATDADPTTAQIIEIAAVRVRNGQIVDTFRSLVNPGVPIPPASTAIHGITDADVQSELPFEALWAKFRAFCADDVIVAHNGYEYDFALLRRQCKECGKKFDLCLYDTLPLARDLYPTSRKLEDLARQFEIDPGRSHRALDDARTLAMVFVKLEEAKISRARKTSMLELLDNLGLALALSDHDTMCDEARLFLNFARPFALGRYTNCLESYERERDGDDTLFTIQDVIDRLGGMKLMERIRGEKTVDERYPGTMLRLRKLMEQIPDGPRQMQIDTFLERVVLSKYEGNEADNTRVNLLTLHSTKGLEFSRVYIIGAEDAELPGGHPVHGPSPDELEEARRLLYVGMTRAKDRLVITHSTTRRGKLTGGHRFLDEMGLLPT